MPPRSASAVGSARRNPRCSATAAKVDPHLLVPGAGAALLGSFDAAGDEVWSAVAVPVRHANAGGLPAIVVGDEQLCRAELRRLLRADVAAPVHPATAPTSPSLLAEAQDQVRLAVPVPVGDGNTGSHVLGVNPAELLRREDRFDPLTRREPAVLQAAEHVEAPLLAAIGAGDEVRAAVAVVVRQLRTERADSAEG